MLIMALLLKVVIKEASVDFHLLKGLGTHKGW
jgi:hypothetical protein